VIEHPGRGLQQDATRLGSAAFCAVETASEDGHSEMWFVEPGRLPVRFTFADRPRPDAVATIAALRGLGLPVELLSGDRQAAVGQAARDSGIVEWRAEATPDGKVRRLRDLAAGGRHVLMVGDGLNDAPALASAHASISPASAAEATQNAADAVFQGDSLHAVVDTIVAARRSVRLARQNLVLALLYNLCAVPLAIAGEVTPLIAAVAMSSSSLLVIGNALRLGVGRPPRTGT
jgi:Cu2+-exporting ATPase